MSVDRHWTDKKVEMTESDWRMFQEDFNAQMAEIPAGLQQRDVIGIGETGSGKTTAFVLRILTRLRPMSEESKAQGPYAIVLAPTHERVKLIEIETAKAAHYMGINVVSILYEQSIEEQGSRLRQGCEVVIATPGRLFDFLKRGSLVLNQCHYVAVDGFDRMVDMGFASHVVGVLHSMPSGNLKPENEDEELDDKKVYRTTYMFSATMSPALEWLARQYLRNPVTIGTVGKTTDLIPQNVIMCEESEKLERLKRLLDEIGDKTAIVFVNNRDKADFVARSLDEFGYCVTTLHGRKTQGQREISLEGLQRKRYNVLVATDIGAHQIDVPDVAHVINFDTGTFEIHTHRIRHIGLTGKTGMATTFLTMHDSGVYFELKHMLIQSNSHVPHELEEHEASKVPVRFIRTLVAH